VIIWCVQAVCCSDGEHCCPKDHTCDVAEGTCTQETNVVPWSVKKPASKPHGGHMKPLIAQSELCHCLSDQTCCKSDKRHGCCPFENVCGFSFCHMSEELELQASFLLSLHAFYWFLSEWTLLASVKNKIFDRHLSDTHVSVCFRWKAV